MKQLLLRLPLDLHAAIVAVAKEQRRSINAQIVFIVEEWLAGRGKR